MRGGSIAPAVVLALLAGTAALPHLALAASREASRSSKPLEAKLRTLEGDKVRLSEYRGEPILLELWATWCQPCRQQAEILRDLAPELQKLEIAVLAVDQGEEEEVVQSFLSEHPSHAPVLLDRWQRVATQLEVGELPALVLLRPDGSVAALHLGVTSKEDLLESIEALEADG